MTIPESFTLLGEKWTVEYSDDPENSGNLGWCDSTKNVIVIQRRNFGKEVSHNKQVSTFYHELIHAFLTAGAFFDLEGDEHFVSVMGGLLHQYLDTYEEDSDLPF